jgi:hypothetical protein
MHAFREQPTSGTSPLFKEERSFSMICALGDHDRMISPNPFALCFKNVFFASCKILCAHFTLAKAMCLLILDNFLLLKSSVYAGFRRLSTRIKRQNGRKGLDYVITGDDSWLNFKHSHAAPLRDKVPKRLNTKLISKSARFRSFGPSTESTVCWMHAWVFHIIMHSFIIPLCWIFLKYSAHIAEKDLERPHNAFGQCTSWQFQEIYWMSRAILCL